MNVTATANNAAMLKPKCIEAVLACTDDNFSAFSLNLAESSASLLLTVHPDPPTQTSKSWHVK